jgi:peptide/nickel transport system permease protein
MGLDDPIPVRYTKWFTSILRGDFGYSFRSRSPVSDLMLQRLPTTLYVIGTAYLISVLLAIPVGVISAIRQYSVFDNIATTLAFIGFSLPTFFTGLLFILIFSVKLGWFPMIYRATIDEPGLRGLWLKIEQAIMPITVLALFQTAALTRYTRASMLETIHQDYVRTARAKGLSELTVISRHALRNALIPVVTIIALSIPGIFTGAVITEQIFRVPGMGSLLITAINDNDTPVIMAITIIFSALVVLFNLIADVLYGVLDPRIKYE